MKSFLRKIYLAIAVLVTTISGQLQGNYNDYEISPYASPSYCDYKGSADFWENLFFRADVLGWQARQYGLEFELTNTEETIVSDTTDDSGVPFVQTSQNSSKDNPLTFDWGCGFRLGIGYNFACGWEGVVDWTHFRGHGQGGGSTLNTISNGNWKLFYDVVDALVVGPQFYITEVLSWQLYGGLRFAEINQRLKTLEETFETTTFLPPSPPNLETIILAINNSASFWGIGPEIGIKGNWDLGCDFGLFGKIGGAILYGHYKTKSDAAESDIITGGTPEEIFTASREHARVYNCQPVLDFALGVSWQMPFCLCDRNADLRLKLSWEHFQWFNHNAVGIEGLAGLGGDLCIDGLTFSSEIQF